MLDLLSTDLESHVSAAILRDSNQSVQHTVRTSVEKKKNGIFYTPDVATRVLARWAIQSSSDCVLEPSFGGCGFLAAARERLIELGNQTPALCLFGCDVDLAAFRFLSQLFAGEPPQGHFIEQDFLTLSSSDLGQESFDVVIGNPPYVSLHNMSVEQRTVARQVANRPGVALSKKASLWAYFVLHSLSFLRPSGRMAWILPGSFLHAEYSSSLREKLSWSFKRVLAVQLEQRLFLEEGTEENSVVLLCEGYKCGAPVGDIELARVADVAALERMIDGWSGGDPVGVTWSARTQYSLFPPAFRQVWDSLAERLPIKLGDFVTFRIGIVTGANHFFIVDDQSVEANQLPPEVLRPIIGKFVHCHGLEVTDEDLITLRSSGARCLLFDTARLTELEPVQMYLAKFEEADRLKNATFKKRPRWDQPDDGLIPDGFFSAMQADGPTLVLNASEASCSNTVYRVWFRSEVERSIRGLVAISLQSTFSQLSAEVEGRCYGSGGLKLEPSEAARIQVALPSTLSQAEIDAAFAGIDAKLREKDRAGARALADELLCSGGVFNPEELSILQAQLTRVRESRRHSTRKLRAK